MLKRAAMMIGLIGFLGCGGVEGTNGGNAQPSQQAVNGDIQEITSYILRLASDIDGSSCGTFHASAATFPGVFSCSGSGDTTITIMEQNCEDGPPLQASLIVNIDLKNCSDPTGSTATGGFDIDFQLNGNTGFAQITSSNFQEDGIDYTLNISGVVDGQGNITCSGTATANSVSCGISQNCTSCSF